MDVLLGKTDNYCSVFLCLLFLLSLLLLYFLAQSCVNENILCANQKFDVKANVNIHKANSKIF